MNYLCNRSFVCKIKTCVHRVPHKRKESCGKQSCKEFDMLPTHCVPTVIDIKEK